MALRYFEVPLYLILFIYFSKSKVGGGGGVAPPSGPLRGPCFEDCIGGSRAGMTGKLTIPLKDHRGNHHLA